jgi:acyl-CoA reductase-like NAD-dependent aldehyde dehydrogenase
LVIKAFPAFATGCTVVHTPSEVAPFTAHVLAEIFHEAGVPAGVYNLVDGDGPTVGAAISGHPGIRMVSFTGSTAAGIDVAKRAARLQYRSARRLLAADFRRRARPASSVKRGLSGNKILAGVDIDRITSGIDSDR